jgi:hypothetical protein
LNHTQNTHKERGNKKGGEIRETHPLFLSTKNAAATATNTAAAAAAAAAAAVADTDTSAYAVSSPAVPVGVGHFKLLLLQANLLPTTLTPTTLTPEHTAVVVIDDCEGVKGDRP